MTSVSTDRRFGVNSGMAIKVPVKAATTANITLYGEQTIDGVACVTGDRVLVKDQTSGVNNGVYDVDTGTWTRSLDFDGPYDVTKGTIIKVNGGTTGQGFWYVSTADPITIGTTSIAFAMASSVLAVISAFMQTVLDDTTVAAARTTLGVVRTGEVTMIPTGDTPTTWEVYKEDGSILSIAGTTTDGLQEAIDYACTNGYNLQVYGRNGISGIANFELLSCTTGIVWPMMQGMSIRFDFVTVQFSAAVTGVGMTFDSCMMVDFEFNGQIGYLGNARAVDFVPTTATLDGPIAIVDSKFHFKTIATNGGTNPGGVLLDDTNGAILGNEFSFSELNGVSDGQHGLQLYSAGTNGIIGNTITCPHLHAFSGGSLRVGTANNTGVTKNNIDVTIYPSGAGSVGVQVYGQDNFIKCSVLSNEGVVNEGIKLETDAARNTFIVLANDGATPVNDTSTTKDSVGFLRSKQLSIAGVQFPATAVASSNVNELDDYDEYTAASAACTGAVTAAAVWKLTKIGNKVTLVLPPVQSNGVATTNFVFGTAIPAKYRPAVDTAFLSAPLISNASNQALPGLILITAATGVISVYLEGTRASNFTVTANAGLQAATGVSWTI